MSSNLIKRILYFTLGSIGTIVGETAGFEILAYQPFILVLVNKCALN